MSSHHDESRNQAPKRYLASARPLSAIASLSLAAWACQAQVYEASVAPPTTALENTRYQDGALELCRLSQGSLPNWGQSQRWQVYLEPERFQDMQKVAQGLLNEIEESYWPKYLAISDFIAEHNRCRFFNEAQKPEPGRERWKAAFVQRYPILPALPAQLPAQHSLSPKRQQALWRQILEESYDGRLEEREFTLDLEVQRTEKNAKLQLHGDFIQHLAKQFIRQDAKRQFEQALETGDFEKAELAQRERCALKDEACQEDAERLHREKMKAQERAQYFEDFIAIGELKHRLIVRQSQHTLIQFEIKNRGPKDISSLSLRYTDLTESKSCVLSSDAFGREPLTLPAKSQKEAFCLFKGSVMPNFHFSLLTMTP